MDRKIIEERIGPLTKDSLPLFGIMTAQHMIEHLTLTVKISYGRIKLTEFEPTEKQLVQKQTLLFTAIEFPKGVIAPGIGEKLLELRYPNLDSAKDELLNSVEAYNKHFAEFPNDLVIHPRFGKLNHEEWERFHRKHFEHHLRQFGL